MPTAGGGHRCDNCGAPFGAPRGVTTIVCKFCGQTTYSKPTTTELQAVSAVAALGSVSVHQRLLAGPSASQIGRGARYDVASMNARDPVSLERGIWPTGATASSTYGGGWSPSAILGPPRVWPDYGDERGAWAPGPSTSAAEWLEATYSVPAPVAAIRVFETHRAGSTYAVVDLSAGEEVLWADLPTTFDEATVLEIAVEPPRVITRLRLYTANPGWAEIDSIGLVAATPLPEAQRTRASVRSAGGGASCMSAVVLVAAIAAVAVAAIIAIAALSQ